MVKGLARVLALCLAMGIFAIGAAPASAQQDVLRIGAAVSLTGAFAREGQLTRDGYQFWVEKVNEAGGI